MVYRHNYCLSGHCTLPVFYSTFGDSLRNVFLWYILSQKSVILRFLISSWDLNEERVRGSLAYVPLFRSNPENPFPFLDCSKCAEGCFRSRFDNTTFRSCDRLWQACNSGGKPHYRTTLFETRRREEQLRIASQFSAGKRNCEVTEQWCYCNKTSGHRTDSKIISDYCRWDSNCFK
jgi:hypothetical protein